MTKTQLEAALARTTAERDMMGEEVDEAWVLMYEITRHHSELCNRCMTKAKQWLRRAGIIKTSREGEEQHD